MHIFPLSHNCGVGLISYTKFSTLAKIQPFVENYRTGLFLAGFLNSPEYKKSYSSLCKKLNLVYQSEPKSAEAGGKNYFLCVFERKK